MSSRIPPSAAKAAAAATKVAADIGERLNELHLEPRDGLNFEEALEGIPNQMEEAGNKLVDVLKRRSFNYPLTICIVNPQAGLRRHAYLIQRIVASGYKIQQVILETGKERSEAYKKESLAFNRIIKVIPEVTLREVNSLDAGDQPDLFLEASANVNEIDRARFIRAGDSVQTYPRISLQFGINPEMETSNLLRIHHHAKGKTTTSMANYKALPREQILDSKIQKAEADAANAAQAAREAPAVADAPVPAAVFAPPLDDDLALALRLSQDPAQNVRSAFDADGVRAGDAQYDDVLIPGGPAIGGAFGGQVDDLATAILNSLVPQNNVAPRHAPAHGPFNLEKAFNLSADEQILLIEAGVSIPTHLDGTEEWPAKEEVLEMKNDLLSAAREKLEVSHQAQAAEKSRSEEKRAERPASRPARREPQPRREPARRPVTTSASSSAQGSAIPFSSNQIFGILQSAINEAEDPLGLASLLGLRVVAMPFPGEPISREELLHALVHNPKQLLDANGRMTRHFPGIRECHCAAGLRREDPASGIPNIRQLSIDALVDALKKNRFSEVQIVSGGSGGAFFELTLHARLVNEGITPHWILADDYTSLDGQLTLQHFTQAVKILDPRSNVETIADMKDVGPKSDSYRAKPNVYIKFDTKTTALMFEQGQDDYTAAISQMTAYIEGANHFRIFLEGEKEEVNIRGQNYSAAIATLTVFEPGQRPQRRPIVSDAEWARAAQFLPKTASASRSSASASASAAAAPVAAAPAAPVPASQPAPRPERAAFLARVEQAKSVTTASSSAPEAPAAVTTSSSSAAPAAVVSAPQSGPRPDSSASLARAADRFQKIQNLKTDYQRMEATLQNQSHQIQSVKDELQKMNLGTSPSISSPALISTTTSSSSAAPAAVVSAPAQQSAPRPDRSAFLARVAPQANSGTTSSPSAPEAATSLSAPASASSSSAVTTSAAPSASSAAAAQQAQAARSGKYLFGTADHIVRKDNVLIHSEFTTLTAKGTKPRAIPNTTHFIIDKLVKNKLIDKKPAKISIGIYEPQNGLHEAYLLNVLAGNDFKIDHVFIVSKKQSDFTDPLIDFIQKLGIEVDEVSEDEVADNDLYPDIFFDFSTDRLKAETPMLNYTSKAYVKLVMTEDGTKAVFKMHSKKNYEAPFELDSSELEISDQRASAVISAPVQAPKAPAVSDAEKAKAERIAALQAAQKHVEEKAKAAAKKVEELAAQQKAEEARAAAAKAAAKAEKEALQKKIDGSKRAFAKEQAKAQPKLSAAEQFAALRAGRNAKPAESKPQTEHSSRRDEREPVPARRRPVSRRDRSPSSDDRKPVVGRRRPAAKVESSPSSDERKPAQARRPAPRRDRSPSSDDTKPAPAPRRHATVARAPEPRAERRVQRDERAPAAAAPKKSAADLFRELQLQRKNPPKG